ncbi:hypothetical protein CQ018_01015 [Arthrobacter sp. MYb227]|uniref:DMP19 family protein n=1 Tax=Arthrobacter sp. MYb227 TaxID=1848601 RepID=UPI000CFD27C9|nr:hypothetical protein [Arthrobacter sp. MYb227]PQZ95909.1 hypothetical protein CQ018_01015 [Arthrobacter sp. MYb227]
MPEDNDLLERLNDRAMAAYHHGEKSERAEILWHVGALLSFHGLAENGGLVGGAIENIRLGIDDPLVEDALSAFHRFGLTTQAALIQRADQEYARFRPSGSEDLSEQDEALWEALDEEYFEIATDQVLIAAVQKHLDYLPYALLLAPPVGHGVGA